MKYLFLLLILLAATPVFAQSSGAAVLRIDSLPANTTLTLSKGWRYHAGDNLAWARPDYEDSHWDTITVARPGQPLPARARSGVGWFRLRLRLADSLRYQAIRLLVGRSLGAFEVYLNGRRVARYGTFSPDPQRVQPGGFSTAPVDLKLAGLGPEIQLAVRFTPWHPAPPLRAYLAQSPYVDFGLRLQNQQVYRRERAQQRLIDLSQALQCGMFLMLGLLHLAFFRYNSAQRANAYFAAYALAQVATYSSLAISTSGTSLGAALVYSSLPSVIQLAALLAGLRALYASFEVRPGWVYRALWVIAGLQALWSALASLLGSSSTPLYYIIFETAIVLVQLRLTWRAVRQGRRGSWLIGGGFFLSLTLLLVTWAISSLLPANMLLISSAAFTTLNSLAFLAIVAPALGISLFLAREFALDAKLLQVKLGEVERLSAQTLAQEQEKQALLAQQNETLETQVAERTGELQRSLTDLRATQAQLIQKEKMASLGELTAGIAHEIQNPLNFVNNFAEVSTELLDELAEEQARPTPNAPLAAELVGSLRQNLTKITQHGQRASGIVRGMLEHSRASTGERAPTDLNALCDEYLRLAYHGLRAKDSTFQVTLATDFAPGLSPVEAVAGDLGRVLLNLVNNAFYAVQQRQLAGEAGYQPTVRVATNRTGHQVRIQVSDNGTGMSEAVQQKIFQPFFTTKPTGEGTGLGLSLSHDIIVHGHGGALAVASQPGAGSTFTVSLPG